MLALPRPGSVPCVPNGIAARPTRRYEKVLNSICLVPRGDATEARRTTNLSSTLVAIVFIVPGLVLLIISSRPFAPADQWIAGLLGQLGGLLVATGLITIAWELYGKRSFLAEVLSKAQLRSDVVSAGLERVTDEYLQEVEWDELFKGSKTLDVVVAYASTWRNAHRVRLQKLAAQPGGRLRVFLPDPEDKETLFTLSQRFKMSEQSLKDKINEAIADFKELGGEVHVRAGDAVFSCYNFEHKAVLTLYSHSQERRGSVPTFLVGDGMIRQFVTSDIEAILRQSTPVQ